MAAARRRISFSLRAGLSSLPGVVGGGVDMAGMSGRCGWSKTRDVSLRCWVGMGEWMIPWEE